MSTKEYTCVICPNGCNIIAHIDKNQGPVVVRITGNICSKGKEWVQQEIENPLRNISSSIPIREGDSKLVSVRTNRPIPLAKVPLVIQEIHGMTLVAPASIGDLVISKPAGCDAEIIVTRNIQKIS